MKDSLEDFLLPIDIGKKTTTKNNNRIHDEDNSENLVNVLAGELTPKTLDMMRFSDDVVAQIQQRKVLVSENGVTSEHVYIRIIRSDSPCYDDQIKSLSE